MKKNLVTLAAALLCAAAAQAQSSVQATGLLDAYVGSMRYAGDAERTSTVGSGGMTTSWFGFKGSEDLGGGLKANFALTGFMRMDTGEAGRFPNDPFFSRDANVGLSGSFGAVTLGRGLAPNFLPSVIANPLGDSFTFAPLILHMNVPLFNASHWQATTPSDTGWSNEIIYTTPDFSGLKANLHYQFGEVPGSNGKKNIGVNALYFNGPLTLTTFYEHDQISNPAPTTYFGTTKKDWMLGGAYDFSIVKAYLTYGEAKSDDSPIKAKTTQVGASVPLGGPGKVLASWAQTKLTDVDLKRKTFTIGYDYNLSKRTDVYAMFMNDRITDQDTGNSFGIGMRHSF
ncbi:MAG: porin [Burkholderiaceae bacterium]|nr:porin [Burkholderiaceae bacterium]